MLLQVQSTKIVFGMKVSGGKLKILFCFIFVFLKGFSQSNGNFFLSTPNYTKSISVFNISNVDQGARLAAVSIQGLANRDTARILLENNLALHINELYVEKGLIHEIKRYSDIYDLLSDFRGYFSGAVVYDPNKKFTINLATNLAGVENRVIISPEMLEDFKNITKNSDIKDLRENDFMGLDDAFIWYKDNVYPLQIDHIMSVANDEFMHDVYRDYLIEFKIPTFWLPGKSDVDYNEDYEIMIYDFLDASPENIPIIGFWPDAGGKGYSEFEGVKLAGKYGKFTVVNTWVGNYSFHSAFTDSTEYYQKLAREKEFQMYDPLKKYVALIMIESGDSPGYMQFGFSQRQWDDPSRGEVPLSYGINPSMRMLLPVYSKHLYDTATKNDFFFCSISGAGYCYPFEGYGKLTSNPSETLTEYFSITSLNMLHMDLDMLGIYTHPNIFSGRWTNEDESIFVNYIEPMDGLRSVVSGMHRTGYDAMSANKAYSNYDSIVTVHHTLTFWPEKNYPYNDVSYDDEAVSFLENEIKTYGGNGKFIQAMFYSWMYGPGRLKKLMDKMKIEGYKFVTLNEFDFLFRKSLQIPTGSDVCFQEQSKLTVYPNPAADTLFFSQKIDGTIELFDLEGRLLILKKDYQGNKLDISGIPSGEYVVKIISKTIGNNFSEVKVKFIKKNFP